MAVNSSIHEWTICELQPATVYSVAVEGVSKTGRRGLRTEVKLTTLESSELCSPVLASFISHRIIL